jgi:SAM-dependent methyltransferase
MPDRTDNKYTTQHANVDAEAYYRRGRKAMNVAIDRIGHHPLEGYHPLAWRHYTRRLALLDRLATIDFTSALDVGCAQGYFMAVIAHAFSAEVWGVDFSDRAVTVAAAKYGFPVAVAQATALPFADGAFDLVYSTEVIEHVLDPAAMLAEMRRVSRGHVLVTTPVSQTDHQHDPDYDIELTGHVNDFDEQAVRHLFGPTADVQSFRCNATWSLLTVGRRLPPRLRHFFYRLDQRVAKRFGSPHSTFVPLRNRDWMIVAEGAGADPAPREWRCPLCHGELAEEPDALRCPHDDLMFGFVAPDVPDLFVPG